VSIFNSSGGNGLPVFLWEANTPELNVSLKLLAIP